MRMFLDDLRQPPSEGWLVVRTAEEAIALLKSNVITHISFDHDLGTEATGYTVASFIEQAAFHKQLPPISWQIHSANPVGRKNIEKAMLSAERFWQ